MYKFAYFTETDRDAIIDFMKENPFAVVTGMGDEYPVASHLPLEIAIKEDGNIYLSGHLMRNTDHHKAFEKNHQVLIIFNGPNAPVSADWYEKKDVGSTWNYITVHARGTIRFLDAAGTRDAVRAITDKYEGKERASSFENLPEEYIARLVKAIAGFEIKVTGLENVFKLSQNHSVEDRVSIISHLKARRNMHDEAIAAEMEKRIDQSQVK